MNKKNTLTFNTSALFAIFEKIKLSGGMLFSFLKTFNQRQSLRRPELLRILKIIRVALSHLQSFIPNRKRAFIQKLGFAAFALFLTIGLISPSLGMEWLCCGWCENDDAPSQPSYQSLPPTGSGNIQYGTHIDQPLNSPQVSGGGYGSTINRQNLPMGFGTQPQDSSQLPGKPNNHKAKDTVDVVYLPVKRYEPQAVPVVRKLSSIFNDEQGDNADIFNGEKSVKTDLFLSPKQPSTNHRPNTGRQDMPYISMPNGQKFVLDGKEVMLGDNREIVGVTIHFQEKSIPRKTNAPRKRSLSTLSPSTPEHSMHKSKVKGRNLDFPNDNDGPPSPYKLPSHHNKRETDSQYPHKILQQGGFGKNNISTSSASPQKKLGRSPSDVGLSPQKGKFDSSMAIGAIFSTHQELLRGERHRIGNEAWERLSGSDEKLAARLFLAIKRTGNREVEFDDIGTDSSKPFFTLYLDREVSATRYFYDEVNITMFQSPFKGKAIQNELK